MDGKVAAVTRREGVLKNSWKQGPSSLTLSQLTYPPFFILLTLYKHKDFSQTNFLVILSLLSPFIVISRSYRNVSKIVL